MNQFEDGSAVYRALKEIVEQSGDDNTLITESLDIWISAQTAKKSGGRGRSSSKAKSQYGIQKLRGLILELAVRGKLVPQDANDEPASVLLERIAVEKLRLVKEKKIKKPKELPEISEEEKPFELPLGWEWARLQDISCYIQRGKGPKYSDLGKVQVVSQKCVQWAGFDIERVRFVDDASLDSYQPERFLQNNDLLWNSTGTGTVGRINVLQGIESNSLVADSHVTIIRLLHVSSECIRCYISAPGVQLRIAPDHDNSLVSGTTNQVELNTSTVISLSTPVAPVEEQHRIVAKVDKLMALCDELEQQQGNHQKTHQTLVTTILEAMTRPTVPCEIKSKPVSQKAGKPKVIGGSGDSAEDLFFQNIDLLLTTEESIDQLKQTILQLAVMGKLVPQDPNDEPASVLLEKIATEKFRLIKEKKIKKQKPLPEIGEDEKPFELPVGWEWVKFEDVVEISSGVTKGRKLIGKKLVALPYLRVANVQRAYLDLDVIKDIEITEDEVERFELKERDLLITEGGDWDKVGRTAIWHSEIELCIHQNHVFKARLFLDEQNEYWLEKYLNSVVAREYFAGASKQTTNLASINKTQLRGCRISMPPVAEQHRIVTKVDQLMSLCDQLKTRLKQAQTQQQYLADAVVEQAVG